MRVAQQAGLPVEHQTADGADQASARQPRLVIRLQECQGLSKYHRAALDGYVDMLCEASKRNTNQPSEECGLTPTLLAAYSGHLEALRILVGRGGDPERTISTGSNALHLAAARNHINCVSFLVNFGVNMWALDNDLHTAKDVAAMEQKKEVLEYLDQMMAKQSALNTKHVQKLKEKAKISAEKRLKQMRKAQLKAIKQVERDERYLVKLSNNRRLLKAAHSISDIKLVGRGCDAINYSPSDLAEAGQVRSGKPASLVSVINSRLSMQQRHKELGSTSSRDLLSLGAKRRLSSDESSSSSVSSSSGYLSSCSTRVLHYMSSQPKYSDLVALQDSSKASDGTEQTSRKAPVNEQLSFKSNSTLATRLKGIGVSRKVQLKRLLLANASSSNDLTATSRRSSAEVDASRQQFRRSQLDLSELNRSEKQSSDRLCNVQRPIKLKLSRNNDSTQSKGADPILDSPNNIKWPPAPAMSRAISEPDFGAALRNEQDEDETQQAAAMAAESTGAKEADNSKADSSQATASSESKQEEHLQRHLLTKCLSQLKLRHEAITSQNLCKPDENNNSEAARNQPRNQVTGSKSDELLRHQLSAGEFPIRPSIIKQQLAARCGQTPVVSFTQQPVAKKTPSKSSPDSIGSAGSLAQRNSRSSGSSASKVSGELSPCGSSSLSYSSDCSSSVEVTAGAKRVGTATTGTPDNRWPTRTTLDGSLAEFLQLSGLDDLNEVFAKERIDLEALVLLSEEDLKSLGILLGPRRKLLKAIEGRRQLAVHVMVDTQL